MSTSPRSHQSDEPSDFLPSKRRKGRSGGAIPTTPSREPGPAAVTGHVLPPHSAHIANGNNMSDQQSQQTHTTQPFSTLIVPSSGSSVISNRWAAVNLNHGYDSQDQWEYCKPAGDIEFHEDFSDPVKLQEIRSERRQVFERIVAKVDRQKIQQLVILYIKLEPFLKKKGADFKTMQNLINPVEGEDVKDWSCSGTYYLERNAVTIPLKQQLKRILSGIDTTTYRMAVSYMQQTNCFDTCVPKSKPKLTGPATLAPILGCNSPDSLKKENNSMAPELMGRRGWDLYHAQRKYQQFSNGGSNKAEKNGGPLKKRTLKRDATPISAHFRQTRISGHTPGGSLSVQEPSDSTIDQDPTQSPHQVERESSTSTEQEQITCPFVHKRDTSLMGGHDLIPSYPLDPLHYKWVQEAALHLQNAHIYSSESDAFPLE